MADTSKKFKTVKGGKNYSGQQKDLDAVINGRIQPQAPDLEEAVLGAIMIDRDGMPSVIEILKPQSFYREAHLIIFDEMTQLFAKSIPIDLLNIHERLQKSGRLEEVGGLGYLIELSNKVGSAANIEFHARIIYQKYIQRELIRVSTTVIKNSYEDSMDVLEILDEAEKGLYNITDQNLNTGYESLSTLVLQAQKEIEIVSEQGSDLTGVTTGFTELDSMTNGWQPSDLIILAARPGMGKTAFTLSLAKNAAESGKGIAIFSLEMASVQLVQRLISMDAELEGNKLRTGQLDEGEWKKLHSSVEKLSHLPMYIDDTPGINIFELRAKCRRLKQNHDIEMIVIDYLQLMTGNPNDSRGNREQEISGISRALKGLAKELSVPVIALSQLSRNVESRGGEKRPMLSDLRESGAIEQDADIVSFIYRPGYYGVEEGFEVPENLAEIIIAKHRNGSLGTVNLSFLGQFVKFVDPGVGGSGGLDFGSDDFQANVFGSGGIITRPSKANDDQLGTDDPLNAPFDIDTNDETIPF
jgi:replicative DNA helicase